MWVARDKNGVLKLFVCKPTRIDNEWYFDGNYLILFGQNADKFNMLKWEDEPIEVSFCPTNLIEATLRDIFNKSSKGLSEDINGQFYTIYDKEQIIAKFMKLINGYN